MTRYVWAIALWAGLVPAASGQARSNYEELQILSGVLNHVRLNYVDSVTYGDMVRAAVAGLLRSLDPHSHYFSRAEFERRSALERGELGTIGVHIEIVDGRATVASVMSGGPAAERGVQAGDRLVAIDDTSVAGLDASGVTLRLAGRDGSHVRLELERGPRLEPRPVRARVRRTRRDPALVPVAEMVDDSTGYVVLVEFGTGAAQELERAVRRLEGRRMRRLILDLRQNPGGRVVESVDIASLFFPRNTVVFRVDGRKSDLQEEFTTSRDGRFRNLPLVVLVDEGSASASEALAASLQDHDRAVLIGRRSFGKALMQIPLILQNGDVVQLTVGRIFSPSGRLIQRRYQGVTVEQYRAFAGRGGAAEDTVDLYRTTGGRTVRGGGGVVPDLEVLVHDSLPPWFAVAADSGFDLQVADSVAHTLPAAPDGAWAWRDNAQAATLDAFLSVVGGRLGVRSEPSPTERRAMAARLMSRAALVRWGREVWQRLMLAGDPDVQAAREALSRLPALLAAPGN
jgi:carboxyl-terminal processing protease